MSYVLIFSSGFCAGATTVMWCWIWADRARSNEIMRKRFAATLASVGGHKASMDAQKMVDALHFEDLPE